MDSTPIQQNIQGESNEKSILIFGTLGIGKSSLMNWIIGQEVFKASDLPEGETQDMQEHQFQLGETNLTLIDSPGMNDPEMPFLKWINIFRAYAIKNVNKKYNMVILALMSNVRPSVAQRMDICVVIEAIYNISPSNLAFVFTFSDVHYLSEDRGQAWIQSLLKSVPISNYSSWNTKDAIQHYCWSKNKADEDQRKEFIKWLQGFQGYQQASLELSPDFNLNVVGDVINESGDEQMIQMFQQEIESLSQMIQEAINEQGQLKSVDDQVKGQGSVLYSLMEQAKLNQINTQESIKVLQQRQAALINEQATNKKPKKKEFLNPVIEKLELLLSRGPEAQKYEQESGKEYLTKGPTRSATREKKKQNNEKK